MKIKRSIRSYGNEGYSEDFTKREGMRNEIKQGIETEGSIMDDTKRKQLVSYGHMQRMDGNRLSKQVME